MTEGRKPHSLEDLDARLRAAREAEKGKRGKHGRADGKGNMEGIGFAMRIGTELLAALAVSVGIGLLLDKWLGTAPLMIILFVFLGGAAGITNVYRLTRGMDMGVGFKRPDDEGGDGEDDRK